MGVLLLLLAKPHILSEGNTKGIYFPALGMLLPNPSGVPWPCPELSCGLSSSGAGWEEQENLQGSPNPGWGGWGRVGALQEGAVPAGCPLPHCHLPLSCAAPCPPCPHPQPPTTKCPLEHPPCPALCVSMHTFPWHCQLEMVIPALTGPVRSHGQHWEQIAVAVVAADTSPMSPCWVGVTGSAEPSREQLCLHPCACPWIPSVPWLLAPGRGCSPCPLPLLIPVPCHLPVLLELFVPLPRHCWIAGSSPGRKLCFLWLSQEELSPLGDVMGATCPAQTLPAALVVFPEFSGLGACGCVVTQSLPLQRRRRRRQL